MNVKKKITIPKLPYGQGSMTLRKDGTIMYRKRLGEPKKEYTVYSDTPSNAMQKMAEIEKYLGEEKFEEKTVVLYEAMMDWCETFKRAELKRTAYETLKKTIKNYIGKYSIGRVRVTAIDSKMLQKHINNLNFKDNYSHSIIKKCYDALNEFFRFMFNDHKISYNPMLNVVMIKKDNILKNNKKITFLEPDDIQKFTNEAVIELEDGELKYRFGFCLCANIYLGMRAGELLALRWTDIDFDNDTIYVHRNLQSISNDDYDYERETEMKSLGILKHVYVIQTLKGYQNRHIHMNKKAKEFLLSYKTKSKHINPCDYVCCKEDGTHGTIEALSADIERIENEANTLVKYKGTHMIRHTCASLYFRAGVRVELIAALLGHSVDVCRNTYIHFIDEQKKAAVKLINDYDIADI